MQICGPAFYIKLLKVLGQIRVFGASFDSVYCLNAVKQRTLLWIPDTCFILQYLHVVRLSVSFRSEELIYC